MAKKLLTIIMILLFVGTSLTYSIVGEYHQDKKEYNEKLLNKSLFEFGKTLVKEPPILWNATFDESLIDIGRYVEQRDDDGFLIIGNILCNQNYSIAVIKTDSIGNKEWLKIINLGDDRTIHGIIKTKDSGYLICGNIQNGIMDVVFLLGIYILKLDPFGNQQWNVSIYFDEDFQYYDELNSMFSLNDGGYLISGLSIGPYYESFEPFLMKLDAYGNIEWKKSSILQNSKAISLMFQTKDNDYLIACDKCLCKIDSLGNKLWEQRYSYGGNILRIFEKNNDEYQLIFGDDYDSDYVRILSVNRSGSLIWDKIVLKARYLSVLNIPDGGYTLLISNNPRHYLYKFDENWNEEWNNTYYYQAGSPHSQKSYFFNSLEGGYSIIFSGWYYHKFIKTDYHGNEKWNKTIKTPYYGEYWLSLFRINCIRQTNDFGYILCGYKIYPNEIDWPFDDYYDIFLLKVSGVPLELRNIFGGKSVSFVIDNDGYDDFSDIDWQIEYEGNIWKGNNSSGVIKLLEAGNETTIKAEPVSGFGWGNVTIKVEDLSYKTRVFFLGPFLIIDRGYKKMLDDWFSQLFPKLK